MRRHSISRLACDNCRKHKVRCMRHNSSRECRRCAKRQLVCFTGASRPPRRPPSQFQRMPRAETTAAGLEQGFLSLQSPDATVSRDVSILDSALPGELAAQSGPLTQTPLSELDVDFTFATDLMSTSTYPSGQTMSGLMPLDDETWLTISNPGNGSAETLARNCPDAGEYVESLLPSSPHFANISEHDQVFAPLTSLLGTISWHLDRIKRGPLDLEESQLSLLEPVVGSHNASSQNPWDTLMWTTMKYVLILQVLTPGDTERARSQPQRGKSAISLLVLSTYMLLLALLNSFFSEVKKKVRDFVILRGMSDRRYAGFQQTAMTATRLVKHHLGLIEGYLGLPRECRFWSEFTAQLGILGISEASILLRRTIVGGMLSGPCGGLADAYQLQDTIGFVCSSLE